MEWHFQSVIFAVATQISEQGVFLLKVFIVIIYSLILMFLGKIGYMLARSASENVLNRTTYVMQWERTTSSESTCTREEALRSPSRKEKIGTHLKLSSESSVLMRPTIRCWESCRRIWIKARAWMSLGWQGQPRVSRRRYDGRCGIIFNWDIEWLK